MNSMAYTKKTDMKLPQHGGEQKKKGADKMLPQHGGEQLGGSLKTKSDMNLPQHGGEVC